MSDRTRVCVGLVVSLSVLGCSRSEPPPQPPITLTDQAPALIEGALSTYIGAQVFLEIDRQPDSDCDGGVPNGTCSDAEEQLPNCPTDCGEKAADANLFVGPDPADGSASYQRPEPPAPFECPVGETCWMDWTELDPARHRTWDRYAAKDLSAFPQKNACVGDANNPDKQELTWAGVANNLHYGYFSVKRATGNGDSAYFWHINKIAPTFTPGPTTFVDLGGSSQSCALGQQYLSFDITIGDFLLVGEF